jgi:hypothetical protein
MNTQFLLEKIPRQFTTWTIVATLLFIFSKKKPTYIYDALYTLGISVGILGSMLCAYHQLLTYYATSLNISFDFTKIYCYVSHILILLFFLFYKPSLIGSHNYKKSGVSILIFITCYLLLIEPEQIYPYVPLYPHFLNKSIIVVFIVFFLYLKKN